MKTISQLMGAHKVAQLITLIIAVIIAILTCIWAHLWPLFVVSIVDYAMGVYSYTQLVPLPEDERDRSMRELVNIAQRWADKYGLKKGSDDDV